MPQLKVVRRFLPGGHEVGDFVASRILKNGDRVRATFHDNVVVTAYVVVLPERVLVDNPSGTRISTTHHRAYVRKSEGVYISLDLHDVSFERVS